MAMHALLQVRLFGAFQIEHAGVPINSLYAERPQSLLAYLLLNRQAPQSRARLAFLLWPDSTEEQALSNLRNLLHRLRRAIPDADRFLAIDGLTVQWRSDAPYTLDVATFESAHQQAQQAVDAQQARLWLERALTIYQGELLPNIYDDWLLLRREELRRQQIELLQWLIALLEAEGDFRMASSYAQQLLQQDLLNEATYVLQMRLHARQGDRGAVRRVYQNCVDLLDRELDVAPSPVTTEAYERYLHTPLLTVDDEAEPASPPPHLSDSVSAIHSGKISSFPDPTITPPTVAPPTITPPTITLPTVAAPTITPPQPRSMAIARTSLVGRRRELTALALRLADPACRLLTIVGPGGVGKTRLALETARGHQRAFADGVVFVALAPLDTVEQLPTAIANALQLACEGSNTPLEELFHYLSSRELLLVLDNFEHLLAGVELLSALLDEAPALKLLVTARERLNLAEEWLFELRGLSTMPVGAVPVGEKSDDEENEASLLFVHCAQRVRQDFTPTTADEEAINQICLLVGGMPLAIELAATWVRLLSCREICDEIGRNLNFLATTLRNVPTRHRSLRAVFDQSWRLMSPPEQQLFRRLASFRGGFTREAAAQVADASLPMLAALVDKSLVQQVGVGRFALHQLLRHYAQEQLAAAGETTALQDRHLAFYLALVEGDEPTYVRSAAWLEQVAADYENIWVALQWATTDGDLMAGLRLAFSLHVYWEMRGYWQEEYEWLNRLLARSLPAQSTLLCARILTHAGRSALHFVDSTTAATYYRQSLAIARQHQSVSDVVMALIGLGDSQQEHVVAHQLYTEGLDLSRAACFPEGEARALTCLGHLAAGAGDLTAATTLYQQALEIQQQLGDPLASTGLQRDLGGTAFAQQAHEQAEAIYTECLRVYRELGDQPGVMMVLNDLANVALAHADYPRASQLYIESLERAIELGSKWNIAQGFAGLAQVAVQQEQYARAAYLFGVAEQLFQRISVRLPQDDRAEHTRALATVRAQLHEHEFTLYWQQGQLAQPQDALILARQAVTATDSLSSPPQHSMSRPGTGSSTTAVLPAA